MARVKRPGTEKTKIPVADPKRVLSEALQAARRAGRGRLCRAGRQSPRHGREEEGMSRRRVERWVDVRCQ